MAFRDDEIREVIEGAKKLPSTHRKGFHGHTDDVAEDVTGAPTHVPTPENPDDQFSN